MNKFLLFVIISIVTLSPSTANTAKIEEKEKEKVSVFSGKVERHENALGEWKFVEYDNISKNIIQIQSSQIDKSSGRCGTAAGSGVIIKCGKTELHPNNPKFYRGYIVTCDHVVPRGTTVEGSLEIKFQNGTSISEDVEVVMNHKGHDVSLIRAWIPVEYDGLVINTNEMNFKDTVRMIGYGGIPDVKKPRYYEAEIYRWSPWLIVVLEDAARGDSGGAIVNDKGELVGLISRGASMFEDKDGLTITSPLHGPANRPIVMIIELYLRTKHLKKDKIVPLQPEPCN